MAQCMKWRESMKNQLRHKIQNFEYELYDRYDLYLRKWKQYTCTTAKTAWLTVKYKIAAL